MMRGIKNKAYSQEYFIIISNIISCLYSIGGTLVSGTRIAAVTIRQFKGELLIDLVYLKNREASK